MRRGRGAWRGASARWLLAVLVGAAALALVGAGSAAADFTATEGTQFSGAVTPASCASGSSVTINWGDGTSSSGSSDGTSVSGTHTYAEEGTYSGTATCGTTITNFTATVDDASLTAAANSFNATAGKRFSGLIAGFVDADPAGTASDYTATIDWGDGTSSAGTVSPSGAGFAVTGSHTYSTGGDKTFTVTITDQSAQGGTGGVSPATTSASGTAHLASGPVRFKQCPPVGSDTGCQFLIIVTNGGVTVQQDPSQPAYEGAEDALVGIQNNSSKPIQALPMSSPGLFNFDNDGICNPGSGPLPSGCRPARGAAAGTRCGPQSGSCSFPAPAGQPAAYKEPGAVSGSTQNGYEGPTSWFSNVSTNTASGRVNFSPGVLPGQSTYVGLEEPPSLAAFHVGKPTKPPPPPPPVLGKSFDAAPVSGTVLIRLPRHGTGGKGFVALTSAEQLPIGTQVDSRRGTMKLTAATRKAGRTQSMDFGGAVFSSTQNPHGVGVTTLKLLQGIFPGTSCGKGKAADGAPSAQSARYSQTLRSRGHGNFRGSGRYSAATVRGTIWSMTDRCDATLTKVTRGTVLVNDFVRHVRVVLHAGQQYLASPRRH